MAFSDVEGSSTQEKDQTVTRHRLFSIGESNLKAPGLAAHLAANPLFVALLALGLLLLGVALGATGVHLFSGTQVHPELEIPGRTLLRSTIPSATDTTGKTLQIGSGGHHRLDAESQSSYLGQQPDTESLESIMYHYRTDKSKDDKKYSDLFAMLFDPIRSRVRNVMEVGMGNGGSTMVWHDFFTEASIYGVDQSLSRVRNYLRGLPRIHLLQANPLQAEVAELGLSPGSMDIVFESAGLGLTGQERILPRLWPLVRAGGYYVIQDVSWDRDMDQKSYPLLHNPEALPKEVRRVFSENDAFFADTTLGHRAFGDFIRDVPEDLNRFSHNAHVIVIRKRTEPLRAVSVNSQDRLPTAVTDSEVEVAPRHYVRHRRQHQQRGHRRP